MTHEDSNQQKWGIDPAIMDTKPLEEMGISQSNEDNFVSRCIEAQSFAEYLTETDTDAENSSLPHTRRWEWYCKSHHCPSYYTAWTCKSKFLLHLYETPIHREDPSTRSREGRRLLAKNWREETAYDLPKKQPPVGKKMDGGNTQA